MEVTYIVMSEDKVQLIEAIKIINSLAGKEKIVFYHSYQNDKSKKAVKFLLLVESPDILITLGKLWGQLKMNYEINDVFITCDDISGNFSQGGKVVWKRIPRIQFLFFLIIFLLVALLLLYYLSVLCGSFQ